MKHWLLFLGVCGPLLAAGDTLQQGFQHPPPSARPWVYWFPLDGNLSSNGITLDLEAMQRAGIGGVLYMETDQGAPKGPARFGGPLWRRLFQHICAEAHRLGLEVNMNNDAGWCGSGGPWITPDLAMQTIVWTETRIQGPRQFREKLPQPRTVAGYYRDIAVLAFRTPQPGASISGLKGKAVFQPARTILAAPAHWPSVPKEQTVPRSGITNLTARMDAKGQLTWDVPAGDWTILRLGHTPTGKTNHPAPEEGRGLECDKLSAAAAEAHFNGLMAKLIADVGPLAGRTLVSTHIDSWEVGVQNWTPRMRAEFQRRRGYDPLPFLPVLTGRVVDSLEVTERFLWDWRQTISELLLENYAGHFRELARRHGLRLSIEAYTSCPTDELAYAGRADEPMGEFWSWGKYGAAFSCTEMTSAAHVYGKRIVGAEAFTANSGERWLGHPGYLKDLSDWAFCEGINRFVFHRYALQPWTDMRPGMSMGPWGLHYERTQTWWEQSRAWHEYLARCQFLLQRGLFVADICLLSPEGSPITLSGQKAFRGPGGPLERPGYNFDVCPPEVVLERMTVKNGRLTLPDGMSYRVLVLPRVPAMTPALLRKIKDLVHAGATVIGSPPEKSPSLTDYPRCDQEVAKLAKELWGDLAIPPGAEGVSPRQTSTPFSMRSVGRGRVITGEDFQPPPDLAAKAASRLSDAQWIWHPEGNPASAAPPEKRYFRHVVHIGSDSPIASAQLILTADNSFECWVSGQRCGGGEDWSRLYTMNVKGKLKPGNNVIAVTAVNATDNPNPAGLIGVLHVRYANGKELLIPTDKSWQAAKAVKAGWLTGADRTAEPPKGGTPNQRASSGTWLAAQELGPLGMAPWGDIHQPASNTDVFPAIEAVGRVLAELGMPPDFDYRTRSRSRCLRYIHRVIDGTDVYFVANQSPDPQDTACRFRVQGRAPELWWPETGRIERAAVYDEAESQTCVPIRLASYESVFVVFRPANRFGQNRVTIVTRNGHFLMGTDWQEQALFAAAEAPGLESVSLTRSATGDLEALVRQPGAYEMKTADGRRHTLEVKPLPAPVPVGGPWQVQFDPKWGGPTDPVEFPELMDWSKHANPGIKYYSGTATYRTTFTLPASHFTLHASRFTLDLGTVHVMAEVTLNGRSLGILWKPPYRMEVTEAVRPGENQLELKVVNLWVNRQIGDERLPEDSDRNPNGTLKAWPDWLQAGRPSPTGRYTFTSWRLWKKDSPLQPSGLLGPVSLRTALQMRTD